VRISTKGQVTIPQEIRNRLGLVPGTDVEFALDGERAFLTRKDGLSRGEAIVAQLVRASAGAKTSGMTTDEIMALTRGE
jgi:AbrB family looped-hinge helix DNA binding protein